MFLIVTLRIGTESTTNSKVSKILVSAGSWIFNCSLNHKYYPLVPSHRDNTYLETLANSYFDIPYIVRIAIFTQANAAADTWYSTPQGSGSLNKKREEGED